MNRFFKSTLILVVTGLAIRALGFTNRIVMARTIGEEGVGLYMMIMPTLYLIIAITQFGLPVAISKYIAEANVNNNVSRMRSIITISLVITVTLSFLFIPVLLFGAKFLANNLFTDNRVYYPLIAMAPIIPISAVSAVLRGYFQGRQFMNPFAFSQIVEQAIRIFLIGFLTVKLLPYGIEYATVGAVVATVIGELASLLYLLFSYKFKKSFSLRKSSNDNKTESKRSVLKDLMTIAIPTSGSRLIGSITWFLEPIVVAQCLSIAGYTTSQSTGLYGELTGYAIPLLLLPAFITTSLGTSLIPAISEAFSLKKFRLIEYQLQQSLRITFISGALSAVIMFTLADPLTTIMYGSNDSAHFVKFLAPFFIFFFFQVPLQSALQAMNMATSSMVCGFIGAIIKTALIMILATQPNIGINGVSIAIGVGTIITTWLYYRLLSRVIKIPPLWRDYIITIFMMICSGVVGNILFNLLANKFSSITNIVLTASSICILFLVGLMITNVLTKREIERVPVLGKITSKIFFG